MYNFHCPACKINHIYDASWKTTGEGNTLTVRPSILTRFNENGKDMRCHLFITNGKIKYLDDCTHELKGQTVDLNA